MRFTVFALVLSALAVPVGAQPRVPHWGVTGTFTPRWTTPSLFNDLFEVTPTDVQGSDFRVGIVRGKPLGGEWGVSFVHKKVDADSTLGAFTDRCEVFGDCRSEGDLYTLSGASMNGVMIHAVVPFATIKRMVQFGVSLGVGIASWSGDATKASRRLSYVALPLGFVRFNRDESGQVIEERPTTTVPATGLIKSPTALVDVQLAVTANVARGLKLRANGGLSLPGNQPISVSVVWLFGAH